MKASIPDTGTVIRLEGVNAVIGMRGEEACRKCGAAALGLCKGGMPQVLTVRNAAGARVGDTVRIGLAKDVQHRGYVLAYVVPASALLIGAVAGHVLGSAVGFPLLDAALGIASLVIASAFSLRRLHRMDAEAAIEAVSVLDGPWVADRSDRCSGAGAAE